MKLRFSVDRIDEKRCVLIDCADPSRKVVWPLEAMPEGTCEGDLVSFSIDLDSKWREEEERKVKGILKDLSERSGK
ncbi:MAG TPA: DUF3006 family protein [Bacillota bacterium]|nr:MAG: hypothetical protein BWY00_01571 [Firmicutes bacterium ADurb.Bin153]HNV34504.1 DUF3006 family protein [Bacillota bacterium]HPU96000.1 DUF3006 family protein [Bacillota bacterium]